MPSRPVERRAPPVAEQVLAGVGTALCAAIADVIVCAARAGDRLVPPLAFAEAAFHLVALYLPLGLLGGALLGVAVAIARQARWLDPMRARLGAPERWLRPDPDAFAHGVAIALAAAALWLAIARAAEHFATSYHDPRLASYALAGVALGLVVAATLLEILAARVIAVPAKLLARARWLGALASVAGLLLLYAIAAAAVVLALSLRSRRLFEVLDPVALAWGPGAALAHVATSAVVRRLARRASDARLRAVAAVAAAAVVLCLAVAAVTYGHSMRARGVVEGRAILGQRLVRTAVRLTDRDGDGFSFVFGGGDCDDRRADVYPGARDLPGDGVDADCFGGDGSAAVMDFGDGAYGAVPALPARPSFLLVTVDALRPDHLGAAGYARDTSPNLDAFAATATRFERALAQSTRSIRSIPAMFTGMYPSQIAYGPEYLYPSLLPENRTVAEELLASGYQTAVVMGTDYFDRTGGFFQGFADVYQSPTYKPPRALPVDQALPRLRAMAADARPFFLWVHFFNVHEEYLWDRLPSRYGEERRDKYDTEIRLMDEQVRRLLDEVQALGIGDRTVVIVASDHGEAFGEHGTQGHSWTLYEEELRATLMIRVPGVAPRVVAEEVGLFDLAPTILNLAGVRMPRPVPARSLVPLITGAAPLSPPRAGGGPRLLFGELMPDGLYPFDVKTVRRDGKKLHFWLRENRVELYDLRADPGERRDLSDADPATRDELLGLIRAWLGSTAHPTTRRDEVLARARMAAPPATMTRRLDARFADAVTLLGFDLPRTTFAPEERIPLTLYLRADRETERNLFFEVTFEGPPGYAVPPHFHAAHYPLHGNYFTSEWRAGEVLRDTAEIVVPHNIQRPVRLRMRLAVRDGAAVLPYRTAGGTGMVMDLAEIDVR